MAPKDKSQKGKKTRSALSEYSRMKSYTALLEQASDLVSLLSTLQTMSSPLVLKSFRGVGGQMSEGRHEQGGGAHMTNGCWHRQDRGI